MLNIFILDIEKYIEEVPWFFFWFLLSLNIFTMLKAIYEYTKENKQIIKHLHGKIINL